MLHYPLLHPEILAALARAGHGSLLLIADANYAHRTGTHPLAPVIYLNLRPGLLTVDQVMDTVCPAVPIERASVMRPDQGGTAPCEAGYRRILGPAVPVDALARADFRDACRRPDLAATIATGDGRHYANILLTVGALDAS